MQARFDHGISIIMIKQVTISSNRCLLRVLCNHQPQTFGFSKWPCPLTSSQLWWKFIELYITRFKKEFISKVITYKFIMKILSYIFCYKKKTKNLRVRIIMAEGLIYNVGNTFFLHFQVYFFNKKSIKLFSSLMYAIWVGRWKLPSKQGFGRYTEKP